MRKGRGHHAVLGEIDNTCDTQLFCVRVTPPLCTLALAPQHLGKGFPLLEQPVSANRAAGTTRHRGEGCRACPHTAATDGLYVRGLPLLWRSYASWAFISTYSPRSGSPCPGLRRKNSTLENA